MCVCLSVCLCVCIYVCSSAFQRRNSDISLQSKQVCSVFSTYQCRCRNSCCSNELYLLCKVVLSVLSPQVGCNLSHHAPGSSNLHVRSWCIVHCLPYRTRLCSDKPTSVLPTLHRSIHIHACTRAHTHAHIQTQYTKSVRRMLVMVST